MKRIKRILTFFKENKVIIVLNILVGLFLGRLLVYLGFGFFFLLVAIPLVFVTVSFNGFIKRKEIEFLNWWNFRQAIKEAKKKYYKSTNRGTRPGKRYLVIQKTDGKLAVVNNTFIKHYNKIVAKKSGKKITIKDLLEMSYYSIG